MMRCWLGAFSYPSRSGQETEVRLMRRAAIFGTLLLGLLLAGAVSAAAHKAPEAEAKDHAHGAAAKDAHDSGHANQEEGPLSISVDLGIWTLVVFVILLIILRKLAWKPMLDGLTKREENIRGALVEAEKARAEAQR